MRLIVALAVLCGTCAVASDRDHAILAGDIYGKVPHVADGGYWKSTLVLTNLHADHAVSYRVSFFDDSGREKAFPIAGRGDLAVATGTIAAGGSVRLETEGVARELAQGWARVEATSATTHHIGTLLILSTRGVPGRPDFEATVTGDLGVRNSTTGAYLPFDNTGGFDTSFVILNPSTITNRNFVQIFDTEGNLLKTEMPFVGPQSKLVGSMSERWPETRGKMGTIRINGLSSNDYSGMSVLGFRFNADGAFTTIPSLDPLSR